jgi:hypothetical protein
VTERIGQPPSATAGEVRGRRGNAVARFLTVRTTTVPACSALVSSTRLDCHSDNINAPRQRLCRFGTERRSPLRPTLGRGPEGRAGRPPQPLDRGAARAIPTALPATRPKEEAW